jgi:ADP-ribosylglycohydrolase
VPGRLLAGEYPLDRSSGDGTWQLSLLLDASIDCFIDLCEPRELPGYEQFLPSLVQYFHKPLRDHDIPRTPAELRDILSTIEHALAANRVVYVHCRAGIGRTGTVIGCYLVEQGCTGEEALIELQRLWQHNALARQWPAVPETDAQTQYVRNWEQQSSQRRPAASELAALSSLRDRYLGCLLGLAVGDALAAATQFKRPGTFVPVGDLLGGGPFDLPRGAWSDDTAMALAVADSLLAHGSLDPADLLQRWLRWQSDGYLSATGQCVGITAASARALATAQWRHQVFAGSHDPAQLDAEPLTRVAPVAMYHFGAPEVAARDAQDTARMTCQAPLLLECCRLLAAMTHAALAGENAARVLAPAATLLGDAPLRDELAQLLAAAPDTLPPAAGGAGQNALAVLRAARWAFATTGSFRAGALAAVNLGGNSDVIGAVYGMLAGAHFGVEAIPRPWLQAVAQRELLESLADQLLTAALVRIGDAPVLP